MIISRIMIREGARPQVSGFFFKAVVQSVLLFGTETWVVNPCMGRFLGGFQYQMVRQLRGRLSLRRSDGRWEYTSSEVEREDTGFEPMETYIWKNQNTGAQYIATWPIMELCEAAGRNCGAWVQMRWWETVVIDLAGARETAAVAAELDKDGLEK